MSVVIPCFSSNLNSVFGWDDANMKPILAELFWMAIRLRS